MTENSDHSREGDGCGEKLRQKTESLMKRRMRKEAFSSNLYSSKCASEDGSSFDIMPQKTYIFWILIFIIFFIVAVNFTILVIMISVLRIGEGMESMEIISKDKVIKFHGDADFDSILYGDGVLKGFHSVPFKIQSEEGSVLVAMRKAAEEASADKVIMSENEISFTNIDKFIVYDPVTESNVFSTDYKDFRIPKGLPQLDVKKLRVKRLLSPQNANLTVRSDGITRLRGNGGMTIRGEKIAFSADGDIYLNSVNGSIYLLSDNIKIDMKHVPVAVPNNSYDLSGQRLVKQFKLCVCMPQGYLFRVPILNYVKSHLACNYIDLSSSNNPCTKG